MSIVILLLVPVAFWLLLVRPQRQRIAAQRSLISGLEPGEEVLTSGGLIGRIIEVREGEVTLEVAPGTVVRVVIAAVIGRPPAVSVPPSPGEPAPNDQLQEDPLHDDPLHDEPLHNEDGD